MLFLIVFIFQYLMTFQSPCAQGKYITVCSFDISGLGSSATLKNHTAIARILCDFDLIAVQDVQDNGGAAHIAAIVDTLNILSLEKYSCFLIPRAGRGFPGYEGYAYIYRQPVELDSSYTVPYGLKDTAVAYGRIPGWAAFKAGDFDFVLASVHLHWSNLDTRLAETEDILNWLEEYHSNSTGGERDLLIAGVTQRYGNYSVANFNNRSTAYHLLLDNEELGNVYRLPFCEFLPSPDLREIPG